VLKEAAVMLNAAAEALSIENGEIFVIDEPSRRVTLEAVVSRPGRKAIIGEGNWSMPLGKNQPRAPVICFVEVAVDTETGKIEVLKLLQGTDCGQIISRERLEGQLQGVLSGGLGFMLLEDWAIDTERMRILNPNMLDYKIYTALDSSVDAVEPCVIVEDNDPIGPFGARGLGEACLAGAGPAILNAVYNAIGIRFQNTPITVDKVLAALKSGGSK
jgi:xanthine dehydrogenase molybdenum-binding subunit